MSTRFAIIDFETTGISPATGNRATEVALMLMQGKRVVDRFASLMNAGVRMPSFITQCTSISNAMVQAKPPTAQVMVNAARFVTSVPLVAHNAAFDRKLWQTELALTGLDATHLFAYTVLLSRRLFLKAPSHTSDRRTAGARASQVAYPIPRGRARPGFAATTVHRPMPHGCPILFAQRARAVHATSIATTL